MVEILQYLTHDEAKLIHWKEESKVRIMIARTAGPKFSGPQLSSEFSELIRLPDLPKLYLDVCIQYHF